MRMVPPSILHGNHEIQRVVRHVDSADLSVPIRQQHRFDRGALASRGLQSERVFRMLPVEVERDESSSIAMIVKGEVLVDEVDLISEATTEFSSPGFQNLQSAKISTAGLLISTSCVTIASHRSSSSV